MWLTFFSSSYQDVTIATTTHSLSTNYGLRGPGNIGHLWISYWYRIVDCADTEMTVNVDVQRVTTTSSQLHNPNTSYVQAWGCDSLYRTVTKFSSFCCFGVMAYIRQWNRVQLCLFSIYTPCPEKKVPLYFFHNFAKS